MTVSPAIFTAAGVATAGRNSGASFLGRVVSSFGFRKSRKSLADKYQEMLGYDDHMLNDIGVTRLDVLRMREDLFR